MLFPLSFSYLLHTLVLLFKLFKLVFKMPFIRKYIDNTIIDRSSLSISSQIKQIKIKLNKSLKRVCVESDFEC